MVPTGPTAELNFLEEGTPVPGQLKFFFQVIRLLISIKELPSISPSVDPPPEHLSSSDCLSTAVEAHHVGKESLQSRSIEGRDNTALLTCPSQTRKRSPAEISSIPRWEPLHFTFPILHSFDTQSVVKSSYPPFSFLY